MLQMPSVQAVASQVKQQREEGVGGPWDSAIIEDWRRIPRKQKRPLADL